MVRSALENAKAVRTVYFIGSEKEAFVKIGVASDVRKRLQDIRTAAPFPVRILGMVERRDAAKTERELHQLFAAYHTHGEWFRLTPAILEWLADNAESVNEGEEEWLDLYYQLPADQQLAVAESVASARKTKPPA